METEDSSERPYRSHLRPACVPCRRRKSRCQTEPNSDTCLTCKAHKSDCYFPDTLQTQASPAPNSRKRARNATGGRDSPATRRTRRNATPLARQRNNDTGPTGVIHSPLLQQSPLHHSSQNEKGPLQLDAADDEDLNPHIVGPAVTNDSQVLADYLSGIPGMTRSTRIAIPESASRTKPVLFTMVQKRPLGIPIHQSPSGEKLEIIEKLLEPYSATIIDDYFGKINPCMPILDETSFRRQFQDHKDKISPALLACLYAHMITYLNNTQLMSRRPCIDGRFIWNLASKSVYSELHLSPGVSIITAILLNVGGRPTTSLIGNGVLLSSAVSMAHSLGLNHNPLDWNMPKSEKHLRIKIWWALLIHDKWTSLAHGTPPRISQLQQDVPKPTLQHLCEPNSTENQLHVSSVFIALAGLTSVLDRCLQQIYTIGRDKNWSTTDLDLAIHNWVDSLIGPTRHIVVRGTSLDIQGAANLRLAYLTLKLLVQRISLEVIKQKPDGSVEQVQACYLQARQSAEEILIFTQDLQAAQLNDFWLPVGAFAYPTTINFLLRHALETENSPSTLAQSTSFRMARDLIDALRRHKETHDWEMGDVCLAQHAEIMDKVLANVAPGGYDPDNMLGPHDFVMPDASFLDQLFPSLWDPLQNVW